MAAAQTVATASNLALGAMCVVSALPLLGLPFPSRAAATYYRGKSAWMATLSGGFLTTGQAAVAVAVARVAVGLAVACGGPATRESALLLNLALVLPGTYLAVRDGRPLLPQCGMLAALAWCLAASRAAGNGRGPV